MDLVDDIDSKGEGTTDVLVEHSVRLGDNTREEAVFGEEKAGANILEKKPSN